MALARHYGNKSMSLQDLHKGAWVGESVGPLRVVLDVETIGTVNTLSSRYPQSDQELETGVVYKNADGAACDLVTALALEWPGSKRLLMLHECKHTRNPVGEADTKVSIIDVQAALEKVGSVLAEAGEGTPPYAVVFTSNRVFKREMKNSLATELGRANLHKAVVVVRENCVEYFGPSLAPRFLGFFDPQ